MSSENPTTRTRILDTTWRLLETGQSAIRMSDIAKSAGISRQALYLHFPNRADLLIATTRHIDEVKDVDARLACSRATTGPERLDAFIEAWGNYIPEISGVSKALRAMQDTDTEAARAWDDRMRALRHGCAAAVRAISEARCLRGEMSETEATDLLWAILSVETWERLVGDCGWDQARYIERIKELARSGLLAR